MKIVFAGLTDPGRVRKNNEDNFWLDEEHGLMLVADGMGGHAAGEVASQMAVDVIREQVLNALRTGRIPAVGKRALHLSERAHLLAAAVQMANEVIHASASDHAEKRGMGTTIVAVLANAKSFAVAHVGDSRLYLLRQGRLRQVTRDHSLVAEQVAKGLLAAQDAEQSGLQNVLTRALGVAPEVDVDVDEHSLLAGDTLLLCTDGLSRMVEDPAIEAALRRPATPVDLGRDLIRMANERGGKDNVTVVLGRAEPSGLWDRLTGLLNQRDKRNNHDQNPA